MNTEIIVVIAVIAVIAVVALAAIFITWLSQHWVRDPTSLYLNLDGSYNKCEGTWHDTALWRYACVEFGIRYRNFTRELKFDNGKIAEIKLCAETASGTKTVLMNPNQAISVAEGFLSDVLKDAIYSGDEQTIKLALKNAWAVWENVSEKLGLEFEVTVNLYGVATDHVVTWKSEENPNFRPLTSSISMTATALSQGSEPNPEPVPASEPNPEPVPDSNPGA